MGALKLTNVIVVRDVNGQVLLSIPQTNSTQQLDLNHLPKGTYYLEMIDENGDKEVHKITIA